MSYFFRRVTASCHFTDASYITEVFFQQFFLRLCPFASWFTCIFNPPTCDQPSHLLLADKLTHPASVSQPPPPSQPDSGVLRGKIEEQRVMIKMGEEVRRVTSDAEWWEKGDGRRGTRYGRWETRQDMSKMGDKRQETRNMRQEMSHKEILILRHALVVFLSSVNNAVTY